MLLSSEIYFPLHIQDLLHSAYAHFHPTYIQDHYLLRPHENYLEAHQCCFQHHTPARQNIVDQLSAFSAVLMICHLHSPRLPDLTKNLFFFQPPNSSFQALQRYP
uniref:Uncharacterized protein MANES_04G074100 n=1 Tax=Rhizophora mucronata TaxID=61149 RepID=A0A2P2LJN2_RHIMU